MTEITDTDRIDFIERLLDRDGKGQGGGVEIQRNSLIGSQPNMEDVPVQIFTIPSQHQRGKTVREVIDVAMQFESGERDWKKEHWSGPAWDKLLQDFEEIRNQVCWEVALMLDGEKK